MTTRHNRYQALRTAARAGFLALALIGPLAGFAAAQDDGFHRGNTGAGFVLYVSLMRNA